MFIKRLLGLRYNLIKSFIKKENNIKFLINLYIFFLICHNKNIKDLENLEVVI
jgi:hypothetical protein